LHDTHVTVIAMLLDAESPPQWWAVSARHICKL
jgi:hypothetical protein